MDDLTKPFGMCLNTSIAENGYMRVEGYLYHTSKPSIERKEQLNNNMMVHWIEMRPGLSIS